MVSEVEGLSLGKRRSSVREGACGVVLGTGYVLFLNLDGSCAHNMIT